MIHTTNLVLSALDSPYFETLFIKSLRVYYAWTYMDLPAFGLPVCILSYIELQSMPPSQEGNYCCFMSMPYCNKLSHECC